MIREADQDGDGRIDCRFHGEKHDWKCTNEMADNEFVQLMMQK
jgi:hypothetical protein